MSLAMRDWLGLLGIGLLLVLYSVDPWLMKRHFLWTHLTDEVAEYNTRDQQQAVGQEEKKKNAVEEEMETMYELAFEKKEKWKNAKEERSEEEEKEAINEQTLEKEEKKNSTEEEKKAVEEK